MGRFGIHNFYGRQRDALPGVRPLIAGDATRIAAVLAALAVTAAIPRTLPWPSLALAAVLPLLAIGVARVPARFALDRLAAILPFAFLAVAFLPWLAEGGRFTVLGVSISRTGSRHAAVALLKLTASCLWITFLLATTPVPRILGGLRRLRVPGVFVDLLESTLHGLALLAREASRMLLASRARSGGRLLPPLALRRLGDVVASLFVRAFQRGARCATARSARTLEPLDLRVDTPSAPASNLAVEIEGLFFRYPGADHDALAAVSLSIARRSKVAVLGINGAGKTTLLLHLIGVHAPQRGRLRVAGVEAGRENLSLMRRSVGMVFQDPDDQVVGTTVYEDVCFGLHQLQLDAETVAARAGRALAAVGLREKRDRAPFTLSRGERKRAAIAGVLAVGADILVFDEPMASLDPAAKDEIAVVLHDLHLEGRTIIAATHDVDFAAAWADAVVIMDAGRIVAAGPPDIVVDETVMGAAGLAIPLVARPFQMLRPHMKERQAELEPVPRNAALAFRWLRDRLGAHRSPRQTADRGGK